MSEEQDLKEYDNWIVSMRGEKILLTLKRLMAGWLKKNAPNRERLKIQELYF